MSLLNVLAINSQALSSFQKGIDITNRNILNVNNKSYAREIPLFSELPQAGTTITEAKRIFDQRYFDRYLSENQKLAYYEELSSSLGVVENIFNDLQGGGFKEDLDQYYEAINDIIAEPDNIAARETFMEQSEVLVAKIKNSYQSLIDEKENLSLSIDGEVDEVNTLTQQLAKLNKAISTQPPISVSDEEKYNSLLDERDKLLKELSSHLDMQVRYQDNGTVDVYSAKGHALVVFDRNFELSTSKEAVELQNGLTIYKTNVSINGVDLTNEFSKGSLGAKLETEEIINSTISKLNDFTISFADENNKIHKQGYGLDDTTDKLLFNNGTLDDDTNINVSNIGFNLQEPEQFAASSVEGEDSNNENAKLLYNLKDSEISTLDNKTFTDYYIEMVSAISNQKSFADSMALESSQIVETLDRKLQEISGVNLDEELVQLTQLQTSYEAAARVLNVTNELLDTIMGIVG
ncbi:MAG: flagellar hook-associated protein FlgK [Epsilonproteobacteria bacterium]|nr:flagellar hook-associated protein FlgK [Campylobacterota bacterium]